MADTPKIKPRHKILAFYGVPGDSGVTFHRMRKFTRFTTNKNPIEYDRQYVDEPHKETDVVGYAPSIDYGFDKYSGIPVQTDIVKITNNELIGDDAVRTLIQVDTETGEAISRDYSVIPGTEGDNINVYTYSGTFKCKGDRILGTAESDDDWATVTFEPVDDGDT